MSLRCFHTAPSVLHRTGWRAPPCALRRISGLLWETCDTASDRNGIPEGFSPLPSHLALSVSRAWKRECSGHWRASACSAWFARRGRVDGVLPAALTLVPRHGKEAQALRPWVSGALVPYQSVRISSTIV